MNMDDPWGSSPWADQAPLDQPAPKQGNLEITRSEIPARKATVTLEQNTNSPWDDNADDGFGDWAEMPAESGKGLRLDGSDDDGWGRQDGDSVDATKGQSNEMSSIWHENTTISGVPGLAPNPLAKQSTLQNSSDPWATQFTLNDGHAQGDIQKGNIGKSQSPEGSHASAPAVEPQEVHYVEANGRLSVDSEDIHSQGYLPDETQNSNDAEESEDSSATAVEKDQVQNLPEVDQVSRPSSSPSDGSHHEILQESPRTSLDDDPKRPQIPRKVSSKVQELVEHFDGLAKPEPLEAPSGQTPSQTMEQHEQDSEDESDDFGDFEEGHSDAEAEISSERPSTPIASSERQIELKTPEAKPAPIQQQVTPSPHRTPRKFYGPIGIDLDLTILEELYPGSKSDESVDQVFIPDTVSHSSFTSTEERKMWYRISRYGPLRKHNTGDDENYVRVNWPQSQIREGTLKIVARWMEEDRNRGQFIVGGGNKTSSISGFGWNDSKALPVPLASAFEPKHKKKILKSVTAPVVEVPREWPVGLAKSNSSSKSRSPPKTRRRSSVKTVIADPPTPPPRLPVAHFGWNTTTDDNLTASLQTISPSQQIDPSPPAPKSMEPMSPLRKSTFLTDPISVLDIPTQPVAQTDHLEFNELESNTAAFTNPTPASPFVPVVPLNLSMDHVDNDDDDWGDMISSPPVISPPVLLPSKTLRHKKSQSLIGALPSIAKSTTSIIPQKPRSPQISNHRSTMSFDEVIVPQNQSPITSSTNAFDITAFETPASNPMLDQESHIPATADVAQPSATSSDPWASADFSFFDTAPAPAPPQNSTPVPIVKQTRSKGKSVSFANSPSNAIPSSQNQKQRDEVEQDRIVQEIAKGLPDLSYMFR